MASRPQYKQIVSLGIVHQTCKVSSHRITQVAENTHTRAQLEEEVPIGIIVGWYLDF